MPALQKWETLDLNYKRIAQINYDKCIGCNLCYIACEDGAPWPALLSRLEYLAKEHPSPVVRLYIASALQRLPIKDRWPILAALAQHGEDAADQNLPLMIWYAAEPAIATDLVRAADLLAICRIPTVQEFITRRIAAAATADAQ